MTPFRKQLRNRWKTILSTQVYMAETTMDDNSITYFAETNFRNERKRFGIKRKDRRGHMYVVGKTGMGKSTLIERLVYSDLQAGEGLALLDPHGDLIEKIRKIVPESRQEDVIYFDPQADKPLGINPLESVDPRYHHLAASGLISVCHKLWKDSWGPRLEHILRHTFLSLLEIPDSTLLDVPRLLTDQKFRAGVIQQLQDEQVRYFWQDEFERYPKNFGLEAIAPIQNKIGQFLAHRLIRNVVGQPKSSFKFRSVMDEGKVLLVNLAKGRIGEDACALLGALLLTRLELAALSRVDTPDETNRRDFYVYCDEFYNYTTASFAGLLSELRKYRLNLTLAHQFLEQLDEELQAAIFGNVGTIISFRIGARDAEYLAKEFSPTFTESDLINLPQHHVILKLMINGVTADAFSAITLPPVAQKF